MTENRKKWQETGFWDFENQLELVLSGNGVKPNVPLIFSKNCMPGKNLVSSYGQKCSC